MERLLGIAGSYRYPQHLQTPWWAGFNDAQAGLDYYNPRILLVDKYEYQQGYLSGLLGGGYQPSKLSETGSTPSVRSSTRD